MADFKDYFSTQSDTYSRYRPEYPEQLYSFLAGLCPERALAWDCATGNGQAARGLSGYFKNIVATDASGDQIAKAKGAKNIHFRVADASGSGLEGRSVDLVSVAQALHWFELDKFYGEVKRVLKPDGILAVWCYGLMTVNEQVDQIYLDYYHNELDGYWPIERDHIENGYSKINFPYQKINCPDFQIKANWTLENFIGYLRSWSATQRYIDDKGHDPLKTCIAKLQKVWQKEATKQISWPLTVFAGRAL